MRPRFFLPFSLGAPAPALLVCAIVISLFCAPARAELANLMYPSAAFSVQTAGKEAHKTFLTESGVYVLDRTDKSFRAYVRKDHGTLLASSVFSGIDSQGQGTSWIRPQAMAKMPGQPVFAVVDACAANAALGMYPRVNLYRFEETLANRELSAVSYTLLASLQQNEFSHATDVAIDADGRLIVSYTDSLKQKSFLAVYPDVITAEGSFNEDVVPQFVQIVNTDVRNVPIGGIAVNPSTKEIWATFPKANAAYCLGIADMDALWSLRVDESDAFLCTVSVTTHAHIGIPGASGNSLEKFSNPPDLNIAVVNGRTFVTVADSNNNRVVFYLLESGDILAFGQRGSVGSSSFSLPESVFVSDDFSTLAVADTGNRRVRVFEMDGIFTAEFNAVTEPGIVFTELDDAGTETFSSFSFAVTGTSEPVTYNVFVTDGADGVQLVDASGAPLPPGAQYVTDGSTGTVYFKVRDGRDPAETVTFEVFSDAFPVVCTSWSCEFQNSAPVVAADAVTLTLNGASAEAGSEITSADTFTFALSQVTDSEADLETYSVLWTLRNEAGEAVASAVKTAPDASWSDFSVAVSGSYTVQAVVTDKDGASSVATNVFPFTFTVTAEPMPEGMPIPKITSIRAENLPADYAAVAAASVTTQADPASGAAARLFFTNQKELEAFGISFLSFDVEDGNFAEYSVIFEFCVKDDAALAAGSETWTELLKMDAAMRNTMSEASGSVAAQTVPLRYVHGSGKTLSFESIGYFEKTEGAEKDVFTICFPNLFTTLVWVPERVENPEKYYEDYKQFKQYVETYAEELKWAAHKQLFFRARVVPTGE